MVPFCQPNLISPGGGMTDNLRLYLTHIGITKVRCVSPYRYLMAIEIVSPSRISPLEQHDQTLGKLVGKQTLMWGESDNNLNTFMVKIQA